MHPRWGVLRVGAVCVTEGQGVYETSLHLLLNSAVNLKLKARSKKTTPELTVAPLPELIWAGRLTTGLHPFPWGREKRSRSQFSTGNHVHVLPTEGSSS